MTIDPGKEDYHRYYSSNPDDWSRGWYFARYIRDGFDQVGWEGLMTMDERTRFTFMRRDPHLATSFLYNEFRELCNLRAAWIWEKVLPIIVLNGDVRKDWIRVAVAEATKLDQYSHMAWGPICIHANGNLLTTAGDVLDVIIHYLERELHACLKSGNQF